MKYYIGLDAHSTTSTFAVIDENGQCVLRETVKTSEQSLVHVINKIHGELRDRYDALRAKGVDHKDAKVNLSRQIASIALCLLKNNDKYNENYGEYLKERKKLQKDFFEQSL